MSSDFDKSDAGDGIDFHEAERLSVEHFEKTYPQFIALFNKVVREAISREEWNVNLRWWDGATGVWFCNWPSRGGYPPEQGYTNRNVRFGPASTSAKEYLNKLGFDVKFHNRSWIFVSWQRRDGGKYP